MMKLVHLRKKTVKKECKHWGILKQVYCHDLRMHCDVFAAIEVISQLAIKNGEPLFEVEDNDGV